MSLEAATVVATCETGEGSREMWTGEEKVPPVCGQPLPAPDGLLVSEGQTDRVVCLIGTLKNIHSPDVLPKQYLPAAAGGSERNLFPFPFPSGLKLLMGPWHPWEVQGRQTLQLQPGNRHLIMDAGNNPGPLPTRRVPLGPIGQVTTQVPPACLSPEAWQTHHLPSKSEAGEQKLCRLLILCTFNTVTVRRT